jgi:hypothetical protein
MITYQEYRALLRTHPLHHTSHPLWTAQHPFSSRVALLCCAAAPTLQGRPWAGPPSWPLQSPPGTHQLYRPMSPLAHTMILRVTHVVFPISPHCWTCLSPLCHLIRVVPSTHPAQLLLCSCCI